MSEADKLFEELGYKKIPSRSLQLCTYRNGSIFISFYSFKGFSKYTNTFEDFYITTNELKAINKKCEELGWLDD